MGGSAYGSPARKRYRAEDMAAAIDKVHWGRPVSLAALGLDIPRRTLDYKLARCKLGHTGRCLGAFLRNSPRQPPQQGERGAGGWVGGVV